MTPRSRKEWLAIVVCCAALAVSGAARGSVYDFSSGAGADRSAYRYGIPTAPLPPVANTLPNIEFFGSQYTALGISDDVRDETGPVEGGLVAAIRCVFTIYEPADVITQLDVTWEGSSHQDKPQVLWLWNDTAGAYVEFDSQISQPAGPGLPPLDGTMSATLTDTAVDFIDPNGQLTILVTLAEEGGGLNVDYVSVTVAAPPQCATDMECSDGTFCNGVETCVEGTCRPGTPVDCRDGDACTTDSCSLATDACEYAAVTCDDSLPCNGVETCDTVLGCRAGTPIDCDDGIACTVDSCVDPFGTCNNVPNDTACDNGAFCDGAEICDPVDGCWSGTAVDCDDGVACTTDVCNEFGNSCDNIPNAPDCITPATWYVDTNAPGAHNGTSWGDAFNTLQDALAASTYGDAIWVAVGTYRPDEGASQTSGSTASTFLLRNGVAVYGHFAGTETTLAERSIVDLSDPLRQTILSGDIGIPGNGNDNATHVVVVGEVDSTTAFDGFTIRNGSAWGVFGLGGGLYIGSGSPSISNCTFAANNAGSMGGGVYNYIGTPTLTNCTFTGNTADIGGGMASYDGSSTLIDCTFVANQADEKGGGMAEMFGDSTLTNCKFFDNDTLGGGFQNSAGGGMYVHRFGGYGNATMTNCLFRGNASAHGGGMCAFGLATLDNCTFIDNSSTYDAGGFASYFSAIPVSNSIFWDNVTGTGSGSLQSEQLWVLPTAGSVNHCCVEGWTGSLGGVGNTGFDPLFADPSTGNFRLSAGSVCIEGGDPGYDPGPDATDLDGRLRIIDGDGDGAGVVDMGAYEYQPSDVDGDGEVDLDDFATFSACLAGPDTNVPPSGCSGLDFSASDLDGDDDVDMDDLASFQVAFGG